MENDLSASENVEVGVRCSLMQYTTGLIYRLPSPLRVAVSPKYVAEVEDNKTDMTMRQILRM